VINARLWTIAIKERLKVNAEYVSCSYRKATCRECDNIRGSYFFAKQYLKCGRSNCELTYKEQEQEWKIEGIAYLANTCEFRHRNFFCSTIKLCLN
jgi:hypothetical protein